MVVFLDLDEDAVPGDPNANPDSLLMRQLSTHLPFTNPTVTNGNAKASDAERLDPNLNATTRALGCYPIINQITHSIDLNTLHALSRTCRQIRFTLLQYRSSLIQSTLHCSNERTTASAPSARPSSIPQWHFLGEGQHLVSGKVSVCARDLVSDCWRCHTIICRNCTTKSSQAPRLPSRHRRLCPTCLAAPLGLLMTSRGSTSRSSNRGEEAMKTTTATSKKNKPDHQANYCICPQRSHLCAPCGTKLVNADTTYRRIWTWRTRYTTYLGGLGTGIGEGNEGVKCARGRECLGAKDVEVEFECPSSSGSDGSENGGVTNYSAASAVDSTTHAVGRESSTPSTPLTPTPDPLEEKAGYWRQEIEGLGGVVKKKFRKRERVGRTVREWEDEREGKGEILGRERRGECRSWCGWCGKVLLEGEEGKGGVKGMGEERRRVVRIESRGGGGGGGES